LEKVERSSGARVIEIDRHGSTALPESSSYAFPFLITIYLFICLFVRFSALLVDGGLGANLWPSRR
jgi:hypothetical protein